tara:strand:- start:668 stop:1432 length:765 start_codon:yes stop_codon:yes gene_type:complete
MPTKLFDLKGKIALISGASRGIGEFAARLLAEQGAHVIVSSRRQEGCEVVASSIREAGGSAEAFACHAGSMEDIESLFNHIRSKHEKLDISINNAAANPYFGHILDTDLGAYTKTVDVNVRGYFFMSVEAGKLMRENNGGVIVNTASIAAIQPGPMQGVYSITKAAIVNMTRAFAKECGPLGIRCNAILPGLTRTKFASALFEHNEIYETAIQSIPLRRTAEPEDMSGTILYLVSDASKYTNGECIVVDGGLII